MRKPKTLYAAVVTALGFFPRRFDLQLGASDEGRPVLDRREWIDEEGIGGSLSLKDAEHCLASLSVGCEVKVDIYVEAEGRGNNDEYVTTSLATMTSRGWVAQKQCPRRRRLRGHHDR